MQTRQIAEPGTAESAGGRAAGSNALPAHNYPPARSTERVHPSQKPYSINELVILHGLSRRTITRIYEREPGRLIHQSPNQKNGRRYRTITVPVHVYERVKRRMEQTE